MNRSFDAAIAAMDRAEADRLRSRLALWSQVSTDGPRVTANLDRERFLSPERFLPLVRWLTAIPDEEFEKDRRSGLSGLGDAYLNWCRTNLLEGGEVRLPTLPQLVGRAAPRDGLVNALFRGNVARFGGRQAAEALVRRLEKSDTTLEDWEKSLVLNQRNSWVTWCNEPTRDSEPFHFISTTDSDEIRANLGLLSPPLGARKELVLLVYSLPVGIRVFRPTVADAELYPYFRPPDPPEEAHGWTLPWPKSLVAHLDSTDRPLEVRARPEALHGPIELGAIRVPVKVMD